MLHSLISELSLKPLCHSAIWSDSILADDNKQPRHVDEPALNYMHTYEYAYPELILVVH